MYVLRMTSSRLLGLTRHLINNPEKLLTWSWPLFSPQHFNCTCVRDCFKVKASHYMEPIRHKCKGSRACSRSLDINFLLSMLLHPPWSCQVPGSQAGQTWFGYSWVTRASAPPHRPFLALPMHWLKQWINYLAFKWGCQHKLWRHRWELNVADIPDLGLIWSCSSLSILFLREWITKNKLQKVLQGNILA